MQSENNGTNGTNPKGTTKARVLRHEFSSALTEHLAAFANLHKYDDRTTYKEAWMAWLAHDEIAALLTTDVARLSGLGYKGDVLDKLYKSGRYYFRGKNAEKANAEKANAEKANAEKANADKARKYVLLNHALLDAMDDHIERGLQHDGAYTPARGFADFCNMHANNDIMQAEVASLSERLSSGEEAVHAKLKKTYKNRYFMLMNK
jgi:hypothetical protein